MLCSKCHDFIGYLKVYVKFIHFQLYVFYITVFFLVPTLE